MGHILIQSYVSERYFVSTIKRRSSAREYCADYFETMAWEWDTDARERGKALLDVYDAPTEILAFESHFRYCRLLATTITGGVSAVPEGDAR